MNDKTFKLGFVGTLNAKSIPLGYNTNEYFNENDLYLFFDGSRFFLSKVHKYSGNFYTNESLNYKAMTIKSLNLGTNSIITTFGLYPDNSWKRNGVEVVSDFIAHITYNLIFRPGRAFFINDILVYEGIGVTDEQSHNFSLEIKNTPTMLVDKCTRPYH